MLYAINGSYGQLGGNLLHHWAQQTSADRAVRLTADVRDRHAVRKEILGLARSSPSEELTVVHCAALVGTIACDLAKHAATDVNMLGAMHVAEACRDAGARLVYFSTTAIYSRTELRPYTEESEIQPHTHYGRTKWEGERICRQILPPSRFLAIRPCFVYGGVGDRVSTVGNMIRAAQSRFAHICQLDHIFQKDWIHCDDFTEIAWRLIRDETAYDGSAYNVAHGTPMPFGDVVKELERRDLVSPYQVFVPEDDYMGNHIVSTEKLRKRYPDWRPKISLSEGIDRVVGQLRREQ